jgi:hypothetical protein
MARRHETPQTHTHTYTHTHAHTHTHTHTHAHTNTHSDVSSDTETDTYGLSMRRKDAVKDDYSGLGCFRLCGVCLLALCFVW